MEPQEQLRELIAVQSGILVDCFKIQKDIVFLSTTDHPIEIANILEGDPFFIRAGNYMWTILILELNKLFDKKEDYSLEKTLNIALSNRSKVNWKQSDNLTRLENLKTRLHDQTICNIVLNLSHIRNKQSAHLDRNRFNKEVLIHITEATVLLNLAQDIVSETSIALDGVQVGLDFDSIGLCEGSIKNLAEYNKLRF